MTVLWDLIFIFMLTGHAHFTALTTWFLYNLADSSLSLTRSSVGSHCCPANISEMLALE